MNGLRFDAVRKPLELTPEQVEVIREVLERNHAYYMRNYDMPKPCMWPDELVAEIVHELAQRTPTGGGQTGALYSAADRS